MSNAAGDGGGGGGGGGAAVELEFDSIQAAVKRVKDISDTIATLETSFRSFANGVDTNGWSAQPACVQFGTSYKAAVTVYADVISGMKQDLAKYSQALQAAWDEYKKSDENSAAALAKLGAVDDGGLTQDNKGQSTYHDDKHHGELSSDKPEQATDTTPDDKSGDTKMPDGTGDGGDNGSSNAAPSNGGNTGASNAGQDSNGNGGAGQSTQPNEARQNNGTSQGGPNGGNSSAYGGNGVPTTSPITPTIPPSVLNPNNTPFTTQPTFPAPSGTGSGGQR